MNNVTVSSTGVEGAGGERVEQIHHHPCTITTPYRLSLKDQIWSFIYNFMLVCMIVYGYDFFFFHQCGSIQTNLFFFCSFFLEGKKHLFVLFPSWDKM